MVYEITEQDRRNNSEREYLLSQRQAEMHERDKRTARRREIVLCVIILLGVIGTFASLFIP